MFTVRQACNCVLILVTHEAGAGSLVRSPGTPGPRSHSCRLWTQETWFPSSCMRFLGSLDIRRMALPPVLSQSSGKPWTFNFSLPPERSLGVKKS